LHWYYFIIKPSDRYYLFDNWLSFQIKVKLRAFKQRFSKKFSGLANLVYLPIWLISTINFVYTSAIDILDISYMVVNLTDIKSKFIALFDNLVFKTKLLVSEDFTSYYGKSLANFSFHKPMQRGVFNLFLGYPYKFKYFMYNRFFTKAKRKFFLYTRRYSTNKFLKSFYVNNVNFLIGFGSNFIYKRIFFIFGQGSYLRSN
jgi:hypothetical protein